MRVLLSTLTGIATVIYPFLVFFGSQYAEPRQIAVLLLVLLLLRLLLSFARKHWSTPLLLAGIVFCVFAVWRNEIGALRLYPVLVNVLMLIIFAWSLVSPPSLIERLARLQHPDLPPQAIIYTRRVTEVWCGFFVLNGSLALVTALWASFEVWSLYNGLIAYLLMGLLFGGEYWIRLRTQKHVR